MLKTFNDIVYLQTLDSDFGKIHIPKIKDILDMGELEYNEILLPFCTHLDMFNIKDEYKDSTKLLDLFFIIESSVVDSGKTYLQLIEDGLKLFFKTDLVQVSSEFMSILLNENIVINRDNFEDLADLIRLVSIKDKIQKEEEPTHLSESDLITWRKIQKAKAKREKREQLSIKDALDIVLHSKNLNYTYETILDVTFVQLMNSYKIIMNIENFEFTKSFLTMGVNPKDMDLTHWSEKIRKN